MKTLLELRKQMEIDFLKTQTYEEINDMFNQLKEKLDIAESELKKLRVGDVSGMLKSFVTYAKSRSISDININDDTIDYFIEDFNLH